MTCRYKCSIFIIIIIILASVIVKQLLLINDNNKENYDYMENSTITNILKLKKFKVYCFDMLYSNKTFSDII